MGVRFPETAPLFIEYTEVPGYTGSQRRWAAIKPTSLEFDPEIILDTVIAALRGEQAQPMLIQK